ncbi:MAG: YecA family protein [Burkholderiales bacterium]|nr:YecA family protein [Burkholderiales bacterium]MDE2452078.1 YecA family protein [Burkholderiales bacterium]
MNARALDDSEIQALQALLDRVPPPLEPLDTMALDGFLCGVILQPGAAPAPERWLKYITDVEGRTLPRTFPASDLRALVRRRHDELVAAIDARDWFDPWVYALDEVATPSQTVLPWVAGFAAAMDLFPALMRIDDPELIEPLALIYAHFDPDDLEDAEALLAVIETLEPPADLGEAVQDLVRSVMLIADVSRPRPPAR